MQIQWKIRKLTEYMLEIYAFLGDKKETMLTIDSDRDMAPPKQPLSEPLSDTLASFRIGGPRMQSERIG
jgi:hypothetical protein